MASDEQHIGTSAGVQCRSIWRRLGRARWASRTLDEFVGTPWAPCPAIDALRVLQVRGVYIALDRQIKLGGTRGVQRALDKPKYTAPNAHRESGRACCQKVQASSSSSAQAGVPDTGSTAPHVPMDAGRPPSIGAPG